MKNNGAETHRIQGTEFQRGNIQGLADFVTAEGQGSLPPVDTWNPPYCGDIGLAIAADGTWLYRESPILRPSMVKLFARILRRDPDGRHYLVTPAEKVDVAVADAPFLAVEMQAESEGLQQRLIFRTNVDDIVICGPDNPLRFVEEARHGGLKPYVRVRGNLEALVTRAVCYDLVDLAHPCDDAPDALCLWSSGACFTLAPE